MDLVGLFLGVDFDDALVFPLPEAGCLGISRKDMKGEGADEKGIKK